MKRLLAIGLLAVALLGCLSSPATAGGNWLEFRLADGAAQSNRSRWDIFATGETVVARVGYLSGTLGPDDGPFHLWVERGR